MKWISIAIAGLLFCPAAHAATNDQLNSITGDFMKMIWALLVVIAVMLGLFAILRKKFAITGNQQDRAIKVLEMRPLFGKKALCLVEVENKKMLLGVSEGGITLLSTLDKSEDFAIELEKFQQTEMATEMSQKESFREKSYGNVI